jgi:hypothetical protein
MPLRVVSIRPTAFYGGVCSVTLSWSGITDLDPTAPLVLQPAVPRRLLECKIRHRLAGPVADRLLAIPTGYVAPPRIVSRELPAALPPKASAELARLEGKSEPFEVIRDEDAALTDAALLVGSRLASAYYTWAWQDTQELVRDNAYLIERLAKELLAHHALGPHQVRAVFRRRNA